MPLDNVGFRQARAIGIWSRDVYEWAGSIDKKGKAIAPTTVEGRHAFVTEVSYLRLGELHVAALPGEVYPEFIHGEFQSPPDAGADFPEAAIPKSIMEILPGEKVLLLGLANDLIGYIVPKHQWDVAAPFAYGRDSGQYGEVNSIGPDTGTLLMEALESVVNSAGRN